VNWLDAAVGFVSPSAGLRRQRARTASKILERHYDAASNSRRTSGWRRAGGDANAAVGPKLGSVRDRARDLVRNNGYAESAIQTIVDHVVGTGIVANVAPSHGELVASDLGRTLGRQKRIHRRAWARAASSAAEGAWRQWAGSEACDAEGRNDFAGIQKLVQRALVQDGEALIRRRIRKPEDGLPIPIQLQVLEGDYLDSSRTERLKEGRIVNGVEYDDSGRRVAYWLFREHPGTSGLLGSVPASERVPADDVIHIFRQDRPGQVRGMSWFAPVLLRFRDFDEFADATLMKQKIAACLAVVMTDPGGENLALGTTTTEDPTTDRLSPGAILSRNGSVEVVQPPSVREYPDYVRTTLREIATGLGVSYEDLTGDYTGMPFSAARMSRSRHWARVEDWQWRILIPQLCAPVWRWAMQAAVLASATTGVTVVPDVEWTAPPMPFVDAGAEALAEQRLIRSGLKSLAESIRERGYDPDAVLEEMAEYNAKLDELGLVLDSDPRRTSQAGQQSTTQGGAAAAAPNDDKGKEDVAPDPDADDEDIEE
jgi:lambda family phage portal protein